MTSTHCPLWLRELGRLAAWIVLPLLAWAGVIVLGLFVAWCLTGCSLRHGEIPSGFANYHPPLPKAAPTGEFAIIGWLAALSLTVGVLLFIASFWVPLIPTKGSASCLAASVGLWALKYALEKYLHLAVNVGLIVGGIAAAVALFPLAHTWVNAHIAGTAKKLRGVAPQAAAVLKEVSNGGPGLVGRIERKVLGHRLYPPASANVGPLPGG